MKLIPLLILSVIIPLSWAAEETPKLPPSAQAVLDKAERAISDSASVEDTVIRRLLAGEWPAKRNLIINVWMKDLESVRNLLGDLRRSMPA